METAKRMKRAPIRLSVAIRCLVSPQTFPSANGEPAANHQLSLLLFHAPLTACSSAPLRIRSVSASISGDVGRSCAR